MTSWLMSNKFTSIESSNPDKRNIWKYFMLVSKIIQIWIFTIIINVHILLWCAEVTLAVIAVLKYKKSSSFEVKNFV